MPPCYCTWASRISEFELPILPFLAPRVFKPWPQQYRNSTRCLHVGSCAPREQNQYQPRRASAQNHTNVRGAHFRPHISDQRSSVRLVHTSNDPFRQEDAVPYQRGYGRTTRLSSRESSKQKTARQWYENAILGLEELLVDQYDQASKNSYGERSQEAAGNISDGNNRSDNRITDDNWMISPDLQETGQHSTQHEQHPSNVSVRRLVQRKEIVNTPERDLAHKMNVRRLKGKEHALRKVKHRQLLFSRTRPKFMAVGSTVRTKGPRSQKPAISGPVDQGPTIPSAVTREEDLTFIPGEFSTLWNHNFARLQCKYDKSRPENERRALKLNLHPNAEAWAHAVVATEGSKVNRAAIVNQDGQHYSWSRVWQHAMLWILQHDIDNAARFLQLTHMTPYPPRSWVADALHLLSMHHRDTAFLNEAAFDQLIETYCTVMERPASSKLQLEGSHLRLLLPDCSIDQVRALRKNTRQNHVQLHGFTHLHFASTLAHADHLDEALDSLIEASDSGLDVNSNAFKSTCATILRKSMDHPAGIRLCLRVISNLVDIGVVLNVQLCNIVMLNAVEAGDMKTAFSTFHSLIAHGLAADKFTYAILLKGCKNFTRDSETLNAVIKETVKGVNILEAPVLATEILHCLYLHHFRQNPSTAFYNLIKVYNNLFDGRPLRQLGILPDRLEQVDAQMQPTPEAVSIMITAYLRSQRHASPEQNHATYRRFRALAQAGEAPFAQLAESDYVANAFLMILSIRASGMPLAAEVMKDMQSDMDTSGRSDKEPTDSNTENDSATNEQSQSNLEKSQQPELEQSKPILEEQQQDTTPATSPQQPFKQCRPTVRTWSIFLHAFTRHKKLALAEQVLSYMKQQGVEPNQVTWNTLINGYAGVQDAQGALEALHRMEASGVSGNEITARALGRVRMRLGGAMQRERDR